MWPIQQADRAIIALKTGFPKRVRVTLVSQQVCRILPGDVRNRQAGAK